MKFDRETKWGFCTFALILLWQVNGLAQLHRNSAWIGNYNTIKVNRKLSVSMDVQIRSTDHWQQAETFMARPSFNYAMSTNLSVGGGIAYNRIWRVVDGLRVGITDNRIYQQISHTLRRPMSSLQNRVRFEERWIPTYTLMNNNVRKTDPHFNGRFRHSIKYTKPLARQPQPAKGFYMTLQNELFTNAIGATYSNGKFFDQTRAYSGLGYKLGKHTDLEGGYMFIYAAGREKQYTINNVTQMILYVRI